MIGVTSVGAVSNEQDERLDKNLEAWKSLNEAIRAADLIHATLAVKAEPMLYELIEASVREGLSPSLIEASVESSLFWKHLARQARIVAESLCEEKE